jgi:hypothetical protein
VVERRGVSVIPTAHPLQTTLIKKKKKIFLVRIYKEIQLGEVAKSYMRKGFLIYEEMRKYLVIYKEQGGR